MEPQAHVNKLEVLEALTEVKTEYPPPHTGPPHAHGDAVSSLAGLAVPGPGLAAGAAWAPLPLLPLLLLPLLRRSGRSRDDDGRHESAFIEVGWHKDVQHWRAGVSHKLTEGVATRVSSTTSRRPCAGVRWGFRRGSAAAAAGR